MRKIAILLGGILAAATMMAADATTPAAVNNGAKWKFNGKVQQVIVRSESDKHTLHIGNRDEDQFLKLEISKQLDDTSKITLKYDTDDNEGTDATGQILYFKKISKNLEAQVAADLVIANNENNPANVSGIAIKENNGGDVYLKWMPIDNASITFKPYEASTQIGGSLKTDGTQNAPGFEFEVKPAANLKAFGALNVVDVKDKDAEKVMNGAVKAGVNYKIEKMLDVTGEVCFNGANDETQTTAATKTTPAALGVTNMGADIRAVFTMDALKVTGEFLYAATNAKDDNAGTAVFAKAEYKVKLSDDMSLKPYASAKMVSEFMKLDDDDYRAAYWDEAGNNKGVFFGHGGMTEVRAGVDFSVAGITLGNELRINKAENKIFADNDEVKGKVDTRTRITSSAKYEF